MNLLFLKKILVINSVLVLCLACSDTGRRESEQRNPEPQKDSVIRSVTKVKTSPDTATTKRKSPDLKNAKNIEFLSNRKEEGDANVIYTSKCGSWNLNHAQLKKIIRNFEPIASEAQYLLYNSFDCKITGEMIVDQQKYEYWLGAGSTLVLQEADAKEFNAATTHYYVCDDKTSRKYFISGRIPDKELLQ